MQNATIEQLLKTRDKISLVVKNIAICRVLTDKLNTIPWSTEIYKPYEVWCRIQNAIFESVILHFMQIFYSDQQGELAHYVIKVLILAVFYPTIGTTSGDHHLQGLFLV